MAKFVGFGILHRREGQNYLPWLNSFFDFRNGLFIPDDSMPACISFLSTSLAIRKMIKSLDSKIKRKSEIDESTNSR